MLLQLYCQMNSSTILGMSEKKSLPGEKCITFAVKPQISTPQPSTSWTNRGACVSRFFYPFIPSWVAKLGGGVSMPHHGCALLLCRPSNLVPIFFPFLLTTDHSEWLFSSSCQDPLNPELHSVQISGAPWPWCLALPLPQHCMAFFMFTLGS
jgi:hypothetical protein